MAGSSTLSLIFGTGPVGMAVMDELTRTGQAVRMVNRSGRTSDPLPAGVELLAGDLLDADFARQAAQGAGVIYHAVNAPYTQWATQFPPLQSAIVNAAEAVGARLVVMDNLYMYGDTGGKPMTEDTSYTPNSRKGQLRAQMARDLMDAHRAGRVQVAVGRASDFIGARVQNAALGGDLVIRPALQGKKAQVIGNPDMPHSYTYMADIGKALVALATHDDAFGQVWHLPTAPAVSTRRMLELIYAQAGHPAQMQVVSRWLLRALGVFNPNLREVVEMLYQFEKPFIVDDSKFVRRFGWGATPTETAIAETVAWFKAHTA